MEKLQTRTFLGDERIGVHCRKRTGSIRSWIAGLCAAIFHKRVEKPNVEDYRKVEFRVSTQRLGVRFTDRIRDVFRFRWIRKT